MRIIKLLNTINPNIYFMNIFEYFLDLKNIELDILF